jgi:hypothetical protein
MNRAQRRAAERLAHPTPKIAPPPPPPPPPNPADSPFVDSRARTLRRPSRGQPRQCPTVNRAHHSHR